MAKILILPLTFMREYYLGNQNLEVNELNDKHSSENSNFDYIPFYCKSHNNNIKNEYLEYHQTLMLSLNDIENKSSLEQENAVNLIPDKNKASELMPLNNNNEINSSNNDDQNLSDSNIVKDYNNNEIQIINKEINFFDFKTCAKGI